jgi:amino acid adenylation domain-containing protein
MESKALNKLSIAEREKLLKLARAKLVSSQAAPASIERADRNQSLPLSWAQQRLWFLDQLDPAAGAAYHIPAALRLSGTLDRAALRASLDRIVTRHEALRTTFASVNGSPQQVIAAPEVGFALVEHDLRELDEDAQQAAVAELGASEGRARFDLARGPLIRGRLLQLSEREHVLLVTQHHIISDGWSIGVLVKEVSALYTACRLQQPDPLPPLPIQYADYAAWQRRWLQGEVLQRQIDFWRDHLGGAPALLELPTDRPRPAVQSYRGERVAVRLSPELSAQLRALSQRHGVTLFMTLLAGWSTLLSRLSGQRDIVIGTPVANRQRAEVEPLIGFFVNTLALRIDVTADPDVAGLLAQTKTTTLGAFAHQDLPFEQVVEALQPVRSLSHSPLFQVILTLNNAPGGGEPDFSDLSLSTIEARQHTAKTDLALSLSDTPDGLVGGVIYATDLFDHSTIERTMACWTTLLEAMVADESLATSRLPLLPASERERVLVAFNSTRVPYPQDLLIHEMFEAQARATPDAIAVEFETERLSYGELNRRANQLAHRLIASGVTPDGRVAVCMERNLELVIGLLGILKAGGAYVPLDPTYPPERLAFMLEDSAPMLLITQHSLRKRLPVFARPVVELDDATDDSLTQPTHDPDPRARGLTSRHLAYVIYTSGSTGRPKGAMNEHRAVVNRLLWAQSEYRLQAHDRVLQKTPFGFDVSVWEFFLPLLAGAGLVMARPDGHRDVDYLQAVIAAKRVTTLHFVPSMLSEFLSALTPERCKSIRQILCSGEALPHGVMRRALTLLPQVALHNLYGPTEAAIDVTAWPCRDGIHGDVVPIGRPIANSRIYVLDAHRVPVPVGVVGEIYIGGDGVGRGYLNRPELTAERFLDDPFCTEVDARMYKTGDLGRWLPGGDIEFLGRNDFQVKIRGLRIELGEIEAKLGACAGVREAIVVAREDVPGDKRLVAYIVPQVEGEAPSAATLREHLARELPQHMMPGAFVGLAALPLTPNGKLDRKALPAPEHGSETPDACEAPAGRIEQAIAGIWQELLDRKRVNRHDHFFELGGHSLLAVRLATRLRAEFGTDLAVRDVFARPTLSSLAKLVSGTTASSRDPIPSADRSRPLPLSWSQQRLWFLDQLDSAAGAAYHLRAALRLSGSLDRAALRASLDRIVARHETLRTTFAAVDDAPQQRIAPQDCGFTLIEHDLRGLGEAAQRAAVSELGASEGRAPFDLAQGPLIRGRLLQLAEDEHVLLVTQHHIISDGWSLGVLVKEVSALYTALSRNQPDPLPPLPIQYADYAAWQRQWLQGEALQRQIDFWRAHLGGAPALLELPTDRPRPAVQSYRGDRIAVRLSPELSAQLRALSQRHGMTMFMTLLAGWSALLSRLSGQEDVVIGTPVANRPRAEVEPLIGFFVNTLALRVGVAADRSVAELLAQVKEMTLDAYAHQDLPFEQVVESLQPERSLSHSPVFQVLLSLNNTPGSGEAGLPGLTLSSIETTHQSAQVDLALSLSDAPEGVAGAAIYATDLFDRSTVERMLANWTTLLASMVADDQQRLGDLALLSPSERAQVVSEFNATERDYPHDQVAHALFEAQVKRNPSAIALQFEGGQRVSYGALNRRANQVAHRLLALGVVPDDRVAICMDRSIEMVVGLLGILKAGGAYVPLDPEYPTERLAYMLEDSAPVALLVQAALAQRLVALTTAPTIVLGGPGGDDASIVNQPETDPDPLALGLNSRHLAYVIYTSGSTGKPKGVMVEHHSLCNLALAPTFGSDAESQVLQFASFSFDSSVFEVAISLCRGGCLHLASRDALRPGAPLLDTLRRRRITHLALPPSAMTAIAAENDVPQGLTLILAGEAPPSTARQWAIGNRLFNGYGPTENTVCASAYHCTPDGTGAIPIGRPTANTRIYILGPRDEPVPIGVVGEIHIAGASLARGYLNRPELTAERFVRDPFSPDRGARMYRTGDLGRWLPDGNIEYVGRNDFQVKVRGFRIELGEIEARLRACAGVRDAAVIARDDATGGKRLVAYVVPQQGAAPSPAALRELLQRDLPEFMIPSAYVSLAALPLTSNGKLDRKALPAPDQEAMTRRAYEAPASATERAIADIWQELLGLELVGRHDQFFELGGHSLLAVQLMARLRAKFGIEVSVRDVFAHPTLSMLASVASDAAAPSHDPITPADRSAPLPLSWAQQRLWFLDQLDHAAGAAYHIRAALRLSGALDRAALRASLDRIVARHENLRTTFASVDGTPQQMIAAPDAGFALIAHDLRGLDDAAQRAAVAEHGRAEARAPFDLAAGPLIRGRLLQLSDQEHVLLVTQHHIISDGWSSGVLVKEVSALYAAFSRHEADPLPPLPIQYADYAAWQRQWLRGDVLQRQIDFWRDHLSGAPALLELPTDRPRPALQSYRGDRVAVRLSPALSAQLRELSQRHGVTLFMTLLAGWSTLLSRLSGQDDVVIGTPVANRQRAEVEPLIGFFVNTLALRVTLTADSSVAELLAQVKATTLDAYTHQDLPFEQVVEALQPQRSLSYNPVYQALLSLNNAPGSGEAGLPGLILSSIESTQQSAQTDLSLSLSDTPDGLVGGLIYATDLFDRATVERMLGHWTTLLGAMVADDRQKVGGLALLSRSERAQVLSEFNATAQPYPHDQVAHALFEARVRQHPHAIALEFEGGRRMSYDALNRRANQVAHHLLALGVKPDDRVALCMDRGIEMVVGLLGVLKAGGAYVPLDPEYPTERLAYMLEDGAPVALLTQTVHAERLSVLSGARVVLVDDESGAIASRPEGDLDPLALGLTCRHLAYVIYTSGSTGKPKGVMVEHRSLCNLAVAPTFGTDASSQVLQFASLSFDASVYEMVMALWWGGCLHLATRDALRPGAPLLDTLRQRRITHVILPPSAMAAIAVEDPPLQGLTLILAGEAPPPAARQWASANRLINGYGPTENTVCAAAHHCVPGGSGPIPIGRPTANTRIYLLGPRGEPVPIGVVGEIHIGGVGVARGYLNRRELTAERFVADPFSSDADARMYRSGDLGRWLPDGSIEYLGRNDFQVKIRGFRIELGEIEARLRACVGITDVAVIAREDVEGDRRLVAYVVPQGPDAQRRIAPLRAQLQRELPEHMLPSAFVTLPALPLTPNGKLDREALPRPDRSAVASRSYEAPVGDVEQAIAAIWQELLALERVGRHDHFFELGGHSLLAVRLVARLRALPGLRIALRDVFAHPTLSMLAQAASTSKVDAERRPASLIAPLQTAGSGRPLFCVHPIGGHVSFYQALAARFVDRVPVYGVQSAEVAGLPLRFDSIQEMAAAYAAAIRSIQARGPYRLLGWSTGGLIAAAVAEQLVAHGDEVEYLGLIDSRPTFDAGLDQDQLLLKAALVELRAGGFTPRLRIAEGEAPVGRPVRELLAMDFAQAAPHLEGWVRPSFGAEAFEYFKWQLPITYAHLQLLSTHQPRPVAVPTQVFRASEGSESSGAGDDAAIAMLAGDAATQWIDTDHHGLLTEPHVARIGAAIVAFLDERDAPPDAAAKTGSTEPSELEMTS